MKCRRIKDGNIVWFGSYGKNVDGTAKFYNSSNKHDNYSDESEAIKDTLTQKLQVIKGELFYNTQIGIPLLEKVRSRGVIDSYIVSTISKEKGVKEIKNFSSAVSNGIYSCTFSVITIYNTEIEVDL